MKKPYKHNDRIIILNFLQASYLYLILPIKNPVKLDFIFPLFRWLWSLNASNSKIKILKMKKEISLCVGYIKNTTIINNKCSKKTPKNPQKTKEKKLLTRDFLPFEKLLEFFTGLRGTLIFQILPQPYSLIQLWRLWFKNISRSCCNQCKLI